jgi:son of sevenless
MYSRRTAAPLTIDTKSQSEGKSAVFTAATFHYTEQPTQTGIRRKGSVNRPASRQAERDKTASPRKQSSTQIAPVMAYQNSTQPAAMYVRALYDYEADDRTSLSFKQGDIIQVITQLESGWWDGIINDVRGWFPSNYCAVVPGPSDIEGMMAQSGDEQSAESGTEDEHEDSKTTPGIVALDSSTTSFTNGSRDQEEEAAFWIPQATVDGRLYYFNTMTGVSTMDLPLETPTQANENGPRDRMNVRAPEQTRPPAELMAGGFEREEDDTSASELEGDSMIHSKGSLPRRRRSQISDGLSPSASMESLNTSPVTRNRNESRSGDARTRQATTAALMAAYPGNLLGQYSSSTIPRSFYDDGSSQPITWNRLVHNIHKSVESYRQAINNADRSEYVRKAEDISDHLRMILAAGSGTTDNHSGNPSVISTNKALYPHFRDMMSRFSKLVLSSHMASADWPAPDSYAKCLQEAEGVLSGVIGFVEVAKAQRGEEIPRLTPGFVLGDYTGGNWQSNNILHLEKSINTLDHDDHETLEPSAKLDNSLLERMEDLKRMIVSSIRRLEEHLMVQEKILNTVRHEQISNTVCTAAGKVVEHSRPYLSTLESVNLSNCNTHGTQITDFVAQKQRLYDLVASLVISCQTVGGPLSDEWAGTRGEPLATRMQEVQSITKQLEASMSQIGFLLQQLLQSSTENGIKNREHRQTDGDIKYGPSHLRNISKGIQRPQLGDMGHSQSYTEGIEPTDAHRDNPKVKKFFGEVPAAREPDDTPWYLKLDHEGEVAFDNKTDPPQLRGGTLTALVEQLTRHDRMDPSFNNTFLLTYRSFTTATELFEMLVKRFSLQPPRGISQEEYRNWAEKKQKPIRFRVVNIIKSWLDTYWMENNDEANNELLLRIHTFAKDSIATSTAPTSGPLLQVIEQRIRGQEKPKKLILNMGTAAPTPIIPKNMKKLKFLDIDVTEFARQLTIIESNLYGKIKPTECLNKTWQKKVNSSEPDPAPNVKALILHSNQLTNWVAEMILTQSDVKKRVVVIKHFVAVADVSICKQLLKASTNKLRNVVL